MTRSQTERTPSESWGKVTFVSPGAEIDGGALPVQVLTVEVGDLGERVVVTRATFERADGGPINPWGDFSYYWVDSVVNHRGVRERIEAGETPVFEFSRHPLLGNATLRGTFTLVPDRTGHSYSDEFYRAVADAYDYAVFRKVSPAQQIATASDVPVTTVHRWIREARRRGLLAPARAKGQAG